MRIIDKPGLAPIRHLLEDPAVTEIMINGPHQVFVERDGRMDEVPTVFTEPAQLDLLVDNLVVAAGRGVNVRTPMVDFRMEDGSRVNICIAPVSLQGPAVTIRKFTHAVRIAPRPRAPGHAHRADGGVPRLRRPGPPQHRVLRRYRHGQDHHARDPRQPDPAAASASS